MSSYRLTIPGWHPGRSSNRPWPARAWAQQDARDLVAWNATQDRVPPARGKRRVSVVLTMTGRPPGGDPAAYWPTVLDALVRAGLLVDDDPKYVERGTVTFRPGRVKATEVVLEDLAE